MSNENFETIENKLRKLKGLKPDPYWRTEVREILVDRKPRVSLFTNSFNWRAAVISFCLLIFFIGATTTLASRSLPGDVFYPIKRVFEKTRLSLATNQEKLSLNENLSDKRIKELQQVAKKDSENSSQAINEVENSVTEIKIRVAAESKKLASLSETGQTTTKITETLTDLVPDIEEKQTQLAKIQTELSPDNQATVATIIDRLEEIKTNIVSVTTDPDSIPSPLKPIETKPQPSINQ